MLCYTLLSPGGTFCNLDDVSWGSCEPCIECGDCDCGLLTDEGVDDCQISCGPPPPIGCRSWPSVDDCPAGYVCECHATPSRKLIFVSMPDDRPTESST